MKIDTSKIDGFDAMSESEKIQALMSYEVDVPDFTEKENHYKDLISKANGEAAKYKKQMNERPTADSMATLQDEVKALRRDKTIADYTAQYLALGYSKELADSTAIAMADGDTATVFANQKAFNDIRTAEFEKQKVASIPTPSSGKPIDDFEAKKAELEKLFKYAGL